MEKEKRPYCDLCPRYSPGGTGEPALYEVKALVDIIDDATGRIIDRGGTANICEHHRLRIYWGKSAKILF